jgi:hypothetical protein
MPDPLFKDLFTETQQLRPPPVTQVQARGRQLARRRRLEVAAAVLVLAVPVGLGIAVAVSNAQRNGTEPAVVVSSGPTPTVSPTPAPTASSTPASTQSSIKSSPRVTGITSAMMLRPSDVGAGYAEVATGDGDWTFEFNASVFNCPSGFDPDPVAERQRDFRKGQPQDENTVIQHTGRYPSGQAARYLDGIRQRVSSCTPTGSQSVSIAAEGFAGDEAVLVVFDHGGGALSKNVLVRKGDVLTEIWSKQTRSDSANRELGRNAAARF